MAESAGSARLEVAAGCIESTQVVLASFDLLTFAKKLHRKTNGAV
jgi:hypothetical protein